MNAFSGYLYCSDLMDIKAKPWLVSINATLPSVHVALGPADGIQPDMAAALKRIHPRQSRYISMITGPSRTADIERVLTIGAHSRNGSAHRDLC